MHDFSHLAPISKLFDRIAAGETVLATASAPPCSGKSTLAVEGLGRVLRARPRIRVVYCTYDHARARADVAKLGAFRPTAMPDDEAFDPRDHAEVQAVGAGGACIATAADLLVVNDPIRDAGHATAVDLDRLWDWMRASLFLRARPGGSILVMGSRWAKRDPIGRLRAGEGPGDFEHVNIPALSPDGASFWPAGWPAPTLEKKRRAVGPAGWAALYQGEPIEDAVPPPPDAVMRWLSAHYEATRTKLDGAATDGARVAAQTELEIVRKLLRVREVEVADGAPTTKLMPVAAS